LVSSCRLKQPGRRKPDFLCIKLSVNYIGEMYSSNVGIWFHYSSPSLFFCTFLGKIHNRVLASACRDDIPVARCRGYMCVGYLCRCYCCCETWSAYSINWLNLIRVNVSFTICLLSKVHVIFEMSNTREQAECLLLM
jgi:hypothetical protein